MDGYAQSARPGRTAPRPLCRRTGPDSQRRNAWRQSLHHVHDKTRQTTIWQPIPNRPWQKAERVSIRCGSLRGHQPSALAPLRNSGFSAKVRAHFDQAGANPWRIGIMMGAEGGNTLDDLIASAQRIEAAGIDSVWLANIFSFDAISTLALVGPGDRSTATRYGGYAHLSPPPDGHRPAGADHPGGQWRPIYARHRALPPDRYRNHVGLVVPTPGCAHARISQRVDAPGARRRRRVFPGRSIRCGVCSSRFRDRRICGWWSPRSAPPCCG